MCKETKNLKISDKEEKTANMVDNSGKLFFKKKTLFNSSSKLTKSYFDTKTRCRENNRKFDFNVTTYVILISEVHVNASELIIAII